MWSHYTENHSGICVEYSDDLLQFLESTQKVLASGDVKYVNDPPLLNLI